MISKIYTGLDQTVPDEIRHELNAILEDVLAKNQSVKVFFRADDIGPPSKNYTRMMQLFVKYKTPLCLAVVPAWMTQARWHAMKAFADHGELFCWHMHGYRHQNYETQGKKQEFGPARSSEELYSDLLRGWQRLESVMGQRLTPVFTPPWNRCSPNAMAQLEKIGFKAISRSVGSKENPPAGLTDFPVYVDLHTRKEKDAETGWQNLMAEFKSYLAIDLCSGGCGIMLHHMRMNDAAFVFLEYLLKILNRVDQVKIITYRDLIASE